MDSYSVKFQANVVGQLAIMKNVPLTQLEFTRISVLETAAAEGESDATEVSVNATPVETSNDVTHGPVGHLRLRFEVNRSCDSTFLGNQVQGPTTDDSRIEGEGEAEDKIPIRTSAIKIEPQSVEPMKHSGHGHDNEDDPYQLFIKRENSHSLSSDLAMSPTNSEPRSSFGGSNGNGSNGYNDGFCELTSSSSDPPPVKRVSAIRLFKLCGAEVKYTKDSSLARAWRTRGQDSSTEFESTPKKKLRKHVKCKLCERTMGKKSLKAHMKRFHENENESNDFKCPKPMCGWVVADQDKAKAHYEDHFIKCNLCDKRMYLEHLGQHMRDDHRSAVDQNKPDSLRTIAEDGDDEPYHNHKADEFVCDDCDKVFALKNSFAWHRRNVHSNLILPCDECGKVFKSKAYLRKHKRSHINVNNNHVNASTVKKSDHNQ